MRKRKLILEDGTTFVGEAIGSNRSSEGEVIFYTGMTGYQEVITDASYANYLVTMTYPSVGSYGINRDDFEAITPRINGLIVKEICHEPSNFRSEETLDAFLKRNDIPGIAGIDTRSLTRKLRLDGPQKGLLSSVLDEPSAATDHHHLSTDEVLNEVTCSRPYVIPGNGKRLVVIDLGVKQSLLQALAERNCHITVVPYYYNEEQIKQFHPDGIVVSHGPGNPEEMKQTIGTIERLLGVPLFAIGLGHQLFAKACGATTTKLHVGRFGTNFPVKDIKRDQTWIATQSTMFTLDESSVDVAQLQITYRSLNDGLIEGLSHVRYPAISVQFNVEGAPGSNETSAIIDEFIELIEDDAAANGGQKDA